MKQILTAKITTLRTLYVHVVLNSVMFPQILNDIVLYARHFIPVKVFPWYYFYRLCFEVPQNVTWIDNNGRDQYEYMHKWGKIGSSHLLNENGDLSFLFYFSKQCLEENIQRKFQTKIHRYLLVLRNHLKFFENLRKPSHTQEYEKTHTRKTKMAETRV